MSDVKATIGQALIFERMAPGYVDPDAQATVDEVPLTVRYSAGDVAVTLSPLVASAASITAISGATLTAALAPSAAGAVGERGAAWFKSDETGVIPLQVVEVAGTSITVAAVPRSLPAAPTNGALVWALWSGSVPSHAAERGVPWSVTYTQGTGSGVAASVRTAEGTLSWVRSPFSTGLTHSTLCRLRPALAHGVPDHEQGFASLIAAAEAELVAMIRDLWAERGLWEDDIIGRPAGMVEVHADLAAARYYDESRPDRAEVLRSRALGAINAETGRRFGGQLATVLRTVAVDTDADGVVDEARSALTGGRTSDVSVAITSTTPSNVARHSQTAWGFRVGQPH